MQATQVKNPLIRCPASSYRSRMSVKAFNNKRPVDTFNGKNVKEILTRIVSKYFPACPSYWDVIDYRVFTDNSGKNFEMAMIYFTDVAPKAVRETMKGLIFDVENEYFVLENSGEIPVTCLSSIEMNETVPIIPCTSLNLKLGYAIDSSFILSQDDAIVRGFEGVVVRAFRYRGVSFLSSNKSLSVENSKYSIYGGHTLTFSEMYKEAGGLTEDQLFDTSKPYSATSYTFNISHPLLFVSTKQIVDSPFIVNLGITPLSSIPGKEEETSEFCFDFSGCEIFQNNISGPGVKSMTLLSVEQANHFLLHGYHDGLFEKPKKSVDYLSMFGESILIMRGDSQIIRVNSPSYQLRANFRGDTPNMLCRFGSLLKNSEMIAKAVDLSSKSKDPSFLNTQKYLKKFPVNYRRIDPLIKGKSFTEELKALFKKHSPETRSSTVDSLFATLEKDRRNSEITDDDVKEVFTANMFYMTPFNTLGDFFDVYDMITDEYIHLVKKLMEVVNASPNIEENNSQWKGKNTYALLTEMRRARSTMYNSEDFDLEVFAKSMESFFKEHIPCSSADIFFTMKDLKEIQRRHAYKEKKIQT